MLSAVKRWQAYERPEILDEQRGAYGPLEGESVSQSSLGHGDFAEYLGQRSKIDASFRGPRYKDPRGGRSRTEPSWVASASPAARRCSVSVALECGGHERRSGPAVELVWKWKGRFAARVASFERDPSIRRRRKPSRAIRFASASRHSGQTLSNKTDELLRAVPPPDPNSSRRPVRTTW